MVFGDDGGIHQLATVTGDASSGRREPDDRRVTCGGDRPVRDRDRMTAIPIPSRGAARPRPGRGRPGVNESEEPPVASTNDLGNGLVLNIEGQLWTVVEFQHVKPGKGPAFVRTKLKNVMSGKVVDKTFNAGVKVETANVDKRTMQYLYNDGTDFIFMDPDTYDQISVRPEQVGDAAKYMLENQDAIVARHDGNVLFIELPRQSSSRSPTPSRASRATAPPRGTSPPPWRPAPRWRSRCSSRRARKGQGRHPRRVLPRSGQLTRVGTHQGPQARPRPPLRGRAARGRRGRPAPPAAGGPGDRGAA